MMTTAEILKEAGIRASKTLTRWYQRGLIPKPEIRTHPSGRGKSAYWPDWVVGRCIRIKHMVALGRSLEEIGELLRSIESEAAHPWTGYDFREVLAISEFDDAVEEFGSLISERLGQFNRECGRLNHDVWWRVDQDIIRRDIVARVLKLARQGCHVVLVIEKGNFQVMADFQVSHRLAGDASNSTARIVIPISAEIRRAFSSVTKGIPKGPLIRPAELVVELADDGEKQLPFKTTAKGFKLIRKRRKRKKP